MRHAIPLAVLAAALLSAAPAQAYEQGDWLVRVGASNVDPDNPVGSLLGLDVEIDDDTSITFNGTWMWTKHVGVELLAATPFEHDIKLQGVGKVGSTKHLPPTLSWQWHFFPDSRFQPYVGAGVNWTIFFDDGEEGVLKDIGGTLKLKDNSSVGFAGQVGLDFQLNDRWFINADVRYIKIDNDAEVSLPDGNPLTGTAATADVSVDIDPYVYGLHVGYRFGR
jgi:outer membrane protein